MMMCFPEKTLEMDPTSQRIIPFREEKHRGSPQSQFDVGDTYMSNIRNKPNMTMIEQQQ